MNQVEELHHQKLLLHQAAGQEAPTNALVGKVRVACTLVAVELVGSNEMK